jgi:hypothetical protein
MSRFKLGAGALSVLLCSLAIILFPATAHSVDTYCSQVYDNSHAEYIWDGWYCGGEGGFCKQCTTFFCCGTVSVCTVDSGGFSMCIYYQIAN